MRRVIKVHVVDQLGNPVTAQVTRCSECHTVVQNNKCACEVWLLRVEPSSTIKLKKRKKDD